MTGMRQFWIKPIRSPFHSDCAIALYCGESGKRGGVPQCSAIPKKCSEWAGIGPSGAADAATRRLFLACFPPEQAK